MARSGTRERGDPHPAAATDAGEQQDRAEALARQLHWGQKELDGQPYIGHIERVVALVQTDDEKTVAWLHDVLEDTPTTPDDLRRAWFSEAIIEAVKLLTREKDIVSYADYIDIIRVADNPLALAVKLADLRDHLRPNCPERLRPRYERALEVLTAALPAHQERTEQEESAFRTLKSIAAMLGWENLPPRRILEAEISALKARARADNHHNALTCPYCNPDKLELAAPARAAEWQPLEHRPKIICLCGSTRFIEQFAIKTWELELEGSIVLGCTLLPYWYCGVSDHFAEKIGVKGQRDEHHLRKIDLADEVLVLNIGGYIGESTRNEITYATAQGKPVNYLEPLPHCALTDTESKS